LEFDNTAHLLHPSPSTRIYLPTHASNISFLSLMCLNCISRFMTPGLFVTPQHYSPTRRWKGIFFFRVCLSSPFVLFKTCIAPSPSLNQFPGSSSSHRYLYTLSSPDLPPPPRCNPSSEPEPHSLSVSRWTCRLSILVTRLHILICRQSHSSRLFFPLAVYLYWMPYPPHRQSESLLPCYLHVYPLGADSVILSGIRALRKESTSAFSPSSSVDQTIRLHNIMIFGDRKTRRQDKCRAARLRVPCG